MIIDKELGVVIAENDEEKTWWNVVENIKQDIKILKIRNVKAEKDLRLGAREIEQKFKEGARALIKQNKLTIKVQKEFLKLAENKIK